MAQDNQTNEILPVREGLVAAGDGPAEAHLLGSKCQNCGEVSIGTNSVCLNCGSDDINATELGSEGELWTYTVIRHKPPGEYLGPDPFVPFALGLVELAEGVRIMAPLEGDVDSFEIGSKLRLIPWILQAQDGQAYKAFKFAPVTA